MTMRTHPGVLAGLLVLLLVPTLASAQGVDIRSGQQLEGGVGGFGDMQILRFYAIEGDEVTIKFSVPGKSDLEPIVQLLGAEDDCVLPELVKRKLTLKKMPIPVTGLHVFVVYGAGTTGSFKFSLKIKRWKIEPETRKLSKYSVRLPAGAKVTFDVKAEKGSDVFPGIDRVVGPTGADLLDPDRLKEKKKKAKLTLLSVPHDGWYTLYLAEREGSGSAVIKTKFKDGRPATRKLTKSNGFESMVLRIRFPDGAGGYDEGIMAEVIGESVASATLRFPASSGRKDEALWEDDDDFRYEREGAYQDGVYTLLIRRKDGVEEERKFVMRGGWPTPLDLSITNGSTANPTVSWAGGHGAAFVYISTLEEQDDGQGGKEWNDRYGVMASWGAMSHTAPDGPLDAAPHAFEVIAISEGMKATVEDYFPK